MLKPVIAILFVLLLLWIAMKCWGAQIIGGVLKLWTSKLPGNAKKYQAKSIEKDTGSILNGKRIIFLGSSVTAGFASCGVSFVEYLAAKDGVIFIKEAVSGTTLVTQNKKSYIPRMEKLDPDYPADIFMCQLSTNDAQQELPLGEISPSKDRSGFNTETVAGAIEYIISYASETWNCPVVFYTVTRYDDPKQRYEQLVNLMLNIQKKWNCGILDLWNNAKLNAISAEQREFYAPGNGLHPTMAGYLEWWLPSIEEYLKRYFQ